jgi:hypothetical protein
MPVDKPVDDYARKGIASAYPQSRAANAISIVVPAGLL